MQHFEKLLSPSEYDRQLEPNCPIESVTKKKWLDGVENTFSRFRSLQNAIFKVIFKDCVSDQKM